MSTMSRRDFMRLGGTAAALGALGWPLAAVAAGGKLRGRVVVIGGGFGGATCAKYLRRFGGPGLDITLVEPKTAYVTCPFSNTVLGGLNDMDFITHDYAALSKKYGVKVVHDLATGIDTAGRKVTLKQGKTLKYDRVVVSPGIDFKWDAIGGYDEQASQIMPHAWQAGPQTVALRKRLEAMKDGGVVIIAPPGNPFRCPPGPYERASLIAHYLKTRKPKSKIIILDAKDKFSKQPLFQDAWNELYPGMVEWMPGSQGGALERVDAKAGAVHAGFGRFDADVANIIPPQQAAAIARAAGLANEAGWCPVDQRTFESKLHQGVHVIGDAGIAGKMPKSGFAANSQGKVCAAAVVAALSGAALPEPSYVNTCYSLVGPDYGISVAAVYRLTPEGIAGVRGAGGVSPREADAAFRKREARYAEGWYASITQDMFA